MRLQEAYETHKDEVDFWWVYIKEAHASDGARPSSRVEIRQHQSFEEREEVAATCSAELELFIPQLVDDMENSVESAYTGAPDRLFILGADKKIAFAGEKGPHGFDVAAMVEALEKIVAK